MRNLFLGIFLFAGIPAISQTAWTWTELDTMPIPISNNAVTGATVFSAPAAYSFGGIDTTKMWSGITKRSFRYDVTGDSWEEIAPLPTTLPLIAASASQVQNMIYIIGGYNVDSGGGEISSDEVIIYNPETNSYEANGTPIPVPIDDQVQCVWRDSLIYVITGWSNTGNVPNVQIYDPALDSWSVGTEVTDDNDFKAFGGSGEIIGDTIYYFGGASMGWNFPARKELRKGVIDPVDPTQISWTLEEDGPNQGYRQACMKHSNNVYWLGGSSVSYNYNGVAYNGSGGVEPLTQIMRYDSDTEIWYAGEGAPYSVMDLRGVAQIGPTSWIICGGMKEGQEVSNRTFRLDFDPVVGGISESETDIKVVNRMILSSVELKEIELYSMDGKRVQQIEPEDAILPEELKGIFILKCTSVFGTSTLKVAL